MNLLLLAALAASPFCFAKGVKQKSLVRMWVVMRGEVDAFKRCGWTFGFFGLSKGEVVRRVAVDDDVCAQ